MTLVYDYDTDAIYIVLAGDGCVVIAEQTSATDSVTAARLSADAAERIAAALIEAVGELVKRIHQ
jgi:hypothetical protein